MTHESAKHAPTLNRWFPIYWGNHYKVAVQRGRYREQEDSVETFGTLGEARKEAAKRNRRKVKIA